MKKVVLSITLAFAAFNADGGPKGYGSGGTPKLAYGPVAVDGCESANSHKERVEIIRKFVSDPENQHKWHGGIRARSIPGSSATYSGVRRLTDNITPTSTKCLLELLPFLEDQDETIRVLVAMILCEYYDLFFPLSQPPYTSVTDSAGELRATKFRERIEELIAAEQVEALKP
ncbi:MAG: hypothetical protein MI807_03975 [Verrucomicrobiales bacterium]|nr:hypothetical protein [Verrucomicrobiales bacterium]